ncbi:hypothetical protein MPH_11959 [Macrophomina phaseolina MS6]|uniref:Uncharacterized protein n=1 Tax=Macrophomina phaseolina (strain MS6) TaxID=1126212 RepID=K2QM43_MACPH|nr:hypothetical protein MPH_11959 [Macrophomina phaseolina MS6]
MENFSHFIVLYVSTVTIAAFPIPVSQPPGSRRRARTFGLIPIGFEKVSCRLVSRTGQCYLHRYTCHPNLSGCYQARMSEQLVLNNHQYSLTITGPRRGEGEKRPLALSPSSLFCTPQWEPDCWSHGHPGRQARTSFPSVGVPAYATQTYYLADNQDPRYPTDWKDGDKIDVVRYCDHT